MCWTFVGYQTLNIPNWNQLLYDRMRFGILLSATHPHVVRQGFRKTVLVNFMDICKWMGWKPRHVMNYLLTDIGTSGSLDGQHRLVVKGRFSLKDFKGNIRKFSHKLSGICTVIAEIMHK
ncbi:hypothetical protein MKX01_001942 [Papaver californicum]|nr:hypothetical protein MKX01_001942 [Papaver californicum]